MRCNGCRLEVLERAGADVPRGKFIEGIESIHSMDIGLGSALKLNYGLEDHKGFARVYATAVEGGHPVLLETGRC